MRPSYTLLPVDGKDRTDPALVAIRDMVLSQFLQTMLIYGVEKVEMGERQVGVHYVVSPKITDLKIEGHRRPAQMSAVRNTVFTHWVRMLFLYGLTKIEMNPSEEDIKKVKELWTRINETKK